MVALAQRCLVHTPRGRDATLTCAVLQRGGLAAEVCRDVDSLCDEITRGAAALFLAEEAMCAEVTTRLARMLAAQEAWSDLPIVVFGSEGTTAANIARLVEALGNVTVLDRPVRAVAVMSAGRSALRARNRQYEARAAIIERATALERRDEFLAMLGHELRNPLGAITLAIELITDDAKNEDPLRVIRRQATHLSHLVDDLLDVARVTTGKIILHKERVELRAVLSRSLDAAVLSAKRALVTLSADLGQGPLEIDGDRVRLEQILGNLLTNAIKYTPSGGRVTVELRREEDCARIDVRDDGVGMAEETVQRVFDLFAQADRTLARAEGGLGVGLTIVRRLIDLHGGRIEAKSDGLGRGSTFTVRLPIIDVADERVPESVSTRGEGRRTRRVLVIEDSTDSRELLRLMLETRGHHVEAVADGIEGLAIAVRSRPDAALVDLGLPGLDGLAVARAIRAQLGDEMLLIALTGYGQADDAKRAIDAGFDIHLVKPVDTARLQALLSE